MCENFFRILYCFALFSSQNHLLPPKEECDIIYELPLINTTSHVRYIKGQIITHNSVVHFSFLYEQKNDFGKKISLKTIMEKSSIFKSHLTFFRSFSSFLTYSSFFAMFALLFLNNSSLNEQFKTKLACFDLNFDFRTMMS